MLPVLFMILTSCVQWPQWHVKSGVGIEGASSTFNQVRQSSAVCVIMTFMFPSHGSDLSPQGQLQFVNLQGKAFVDQLIEHDFREQTSQTAREDILVPVASRDISPGQENALRKVLDKHGIKFKVFTRPFQSSASTCLRGDVTDLDCEQINSLVSDILYAVYDVTNLTDVSYCVRWVPMN